MLRICVIGVTAIALLLAAATVWVFLYSRGLPDVQTLSEFAPASVTHVSDPCLAATIAIPYESIGSNLTAALSAAEASENDPGVLVETYRGFTQSGGLHRATLSLQISRTMFYEPSKTLNRQLDELRTAVQMERRFSRRQLFTIFANRLAFGENIVGVESASRHFFHKEPNQLSLGDAALLAGLARAPSYLSPIKHADRAMKRRNEVIDAMANAHTISASEASAAKADPLPSALPTEN